jgi:hypothetical protein
MTEADQKLQTTKTKLSRNSFFVICFKHVRENTKGAHGWLMKAKRGRAAVLRRPNLGKAAARLKFF